MRSMAASVGALFRPTADQRLVGVELELLVYHQNRSLPVTIGESTAALAADPTLMDDAGISFEPGGQIELSPAPESDVETLLGRLQNLVARTMRALEAAGLTAVLEGTDGLRANDAVGLQKASERYLRMQQHFDRIGPCGRRMMRQTASLQVCVSLEPGTAGRQQWLLANLMAPVLQAVFANSPVLEGRRTGLASTRSALWQVLDPSRTGFNGDQFAGDPAQAYLRFAERAAPILISGAADPVATHLTTLFPPVRPRGNYLELRCLDSVPLERVALATRLISRLLHEADLREAALRSLMCEALDMTAAWVIAARDGLAAPQLAARADRLLEIAELGSELELAA